LEEKRKGGGFYSRERGGRCGMKAADKKKNHKKRNKRLNGYWFGGLKRSPGGGCGKSLSKGCMYASFCSASSTGGGYQKGGNSGEVANVQRISDRV